MLLVFSLSFCTSNQTKKELTTVKVKVTIILPVTIDAFDKLISGVKETTKDKFEIQVYSAEADPSKFETIIQSALLGKPAYLITVGTQITNTVFGPKFRNDLPIVIAAAISSPKLVDAFGNIGIDPPRKSPVAIISDNPKKSIYELFGKTVLGFLPHTKIAGILYNPAELNSNETTQKICFVLKQDGIDIKYGVINNSEDIEKVTNRLLLEGVQIMIIPHDKNAVTKASSIVKKCDENNIPVFSLDDGTVEKDGVCIGVSVSYKMIGVLIGQTLLNIEEKNMKAENIPVVSMECAQIFVNSKKLDKLGLVIPKELTSFVVLEK